MIKKRFLLPAAAGALALAIGLAGIWFNQRLPALADFGVPGMDSEAQLMAWAALFPEKGVAALTFRTVLQGWPLRYSALWERWCWPCTDTSLRRNWGIFCCI